jgi:hypothetical protein
MLTALILLVFAVVALILLMMLAVVIAGTWSEPRHERLSIQPPNPLSAMARRLLGVYVRRPGDADTSREVCLAGHAADGDAEGEGR